LQDKNKQEIDILKDHKIREERKNKVAEEEKNNLLKNKDALEINIKELQTTIKTDQD
jgi:hypothetical protein